MGLILQPIAPYGAIDRAIETNRMSKILLYCWWHNAVLGCDLSSEMRYSNRGGS